MAFYVNDDIRCPDCEVQQKVPVPLLECIESNYSGCSVDRGMCPQCGHGFEVAYKVDKVRRAKKWDGLSRDEINGQIDSIENKKAR